MNYKLLGALFIVLAMLLPDSRALAQRGGGRGGGRGGSTERGGGGGFSGGGFGGSSDRGGGFGGSRSGSSGFGGGGFGGGGFGGGEQRGGGGFGGGLSSSGSESGRSDRSSGMSMFGGSGFGGQNGAGGRTSERSGFGADGTGDRGFGTDSEGRAGVGAGGVGRPGVGAGGAGQPGVGAGGAGRPGVGAGGIGEPGVGQGRPGLGAEGEGGPGSGAGFRPGVGAGGGGPFSGLGVSPGFGAGGASGSASGIGALPGTGPGAAGGYADRSIGTHYTPSDSRDAQAADFRADTGAYPHYDAGAFARYNNAWQPTRVVTSSLYTHPGYGGLAKAFGLTAAPAAYDYGGNVVVQPSAVYVNGDVVGTPQQYAQQASGIANTGESAQPAADSKWLPLGVFAVVEGNATSSDDIFQLAINPQGIIRGNYHNLRTNQMESIAGSVDKKTQRTDWTIGGDKSPVYEAGIANLTKDTTPMLVITADGQSHQMSLIRLPQPASQAGTSDAASAQ